MSKEMSEKEVKVVHKNYGGGGAVYGLGMIGALVYYIQNATDFTTALIGVFKALFWPGFLIYEVFNLLGM